jgi:dienelactone hydrolase
MGEAADMNRRVSAAGLIWLLLTSTTPLQAVEANATTRRPERLFFESGGRNIRADRYLPAGRRSGRTIIVLYGAGGMVFDGPSMRRVARALTEAGDTVYLLHYYNRTGTIVARDAAMERHFKKWAETVRDGIGWVQSREGKGARPIGLYGYSLGAFLAIVAASDNPRVGAVTEQAGGMFSSAEKRLGKMPPVLMVHGLEDRRVPVEKYAKPLLRVLRERGGPVETEFVPGEGHVFSEAAMAGVRVKVAKFFARELR